MDTSKDIKYKLHKVIRRSEILLIILVLPIFFSGLRSVKGAYVVAGVESHIIAHYGEEKYDFRTKKTKLVEALEEQGLTLYDQDGFSIDRNTKLVGGEYAVNITKSLPVLINDNGKRRLGRTVYSNARKIIEQNDIKLYKEDIVESELIIDPVSQNGAGQIVTITRAPVYNVIHDNKEVKIRTWETTVKNILNYGEIFYDKTYYIEPALNKRVENGDTIVASKERDIEIVRTESVSYKTIYKGSTALSLGQEKVSQSGVTGQIKKTYKVTYRAGKEISRVLIKTEVPIQKRDEIIIRGSITGKCKWGPYYETNHGPYTTAFHYAKTNPSYLGRYLLVTNLANGESVKVKIVDAGPTNGLLDLSTTAIKEIGGWGSIYLNGYFNVSVQLVD